MALVSCPKTPWKGVRRWNVVARCQLTWRLLIGVSAERKARVAEAVAMGSARRVAQRTPHRFTAAKASTSPLGRSGTGTPGRYHCGMAVADRIEVRAQAGTRART